MTETTRDFACFACGSEGPHRHIPVQRGPGMTDAEWEQHPGPREMVVCGSCQERIWEPDTGDGVNIPNLTLIPPGLRDLAHQALEAREARRFLILAERHYRYQLAEDNAFYLRRRGLWEAVLLAQLRLEQPD